MDFIVRNYGLLLLAAALVAWAMNLTIDIAMLLVLGLVFGNI